MVLNYTFSDPLKNNERRYNRNTSSVKNQIENNRVTPTAQDGYYLKRSARYSTYHESKFGEKYKPKSWEDIKNEANHKRWIESIDEAPRSGLERVIDPLSFFNYTIAGGVKALFDGDKPEWEQKTFLEGVVDGAKASNPFGQGKSSGRETWSDVFEEAGWEGNNGFSRVARGTVGFVADVLLDPTTYLTFGVGAVVKGTGLGAGRVIARSTAKNLAENAGVKYVSKGAVPNQVYEKTLNDALSNGADLPTAIEMAKTERSFTERIISESEVGMSVNLAKEMIARSNKSLPPDLRIADDVLEQRAVQYASTYNKRMGLNRSGDGMTLSLGNVPFGDKMFGKKLASKSVTLLSDSTLRKIGDYTLSPFYNKTRESFYGTKIGTLFSTKSLEYKLAKKDPSAFFKVMMHADFVRGQSANRKNAEEEIRAFVKSIATFSPSEQSQLIEVLENPNSFKLTREQVRLSKSDEFNYFKSQKMVLADGYKTQISDLLESRKQMEEYLSDMPEQRASAMKELDSILEKRDATLRAYDTETATTREQLIKEHAELDAEVRRINKFTKSVQVYKEINTLKRRSDSLSSRIAKTEQERATFVGNTKDALKLQSELVEMVADRQRVLDGITAQINLLKTDKANAFKQLKKHHIAMKNMSVNSRRVKTTRNYFSDKLKQIKESRDTAFNELINKKQSVVNMLTNLRSMRAYGVDAESIRSELMNELRQIVSTGFYKDNDKFTQELSYTFKSISEKVKQKQLLSKTKADLELDIVKLEEEKFELLHDLKESNAQGRIGQIDEQVIKLNTELNKRAELQQRLDDLLEKQQGNIPYYKKSHPVDVDKIRGSYDKFGEVTRELNMLTKQFESVDARAKDFTVEARDLLAENKIRVIEGKLSLARKNLIKELNAELFGGKSVISIDVSVKTISELIKTLLDFRTIPTKNHWREIVMRKSNILTEEGLLSLQITGNQLGYQDWYKEFGEQVEVSRKIKLGQIDNQVRDFLSKNFETTPEELMTKQNTSYLDEFVEHHLNLADMRSVMLNHLRGLDANTLRDIKLKGTSPSLEDLKVRYASLPGINEQLRRVSESKPKYAPNRDIIDQSNRTGMVKASETNAYAESRGEFYETLADANFEKSMSDTEGMHKGAKKLFANRMEHIVAPIKKSVLRYLNKKSIEEIGGKFTNIKEDIELGKFVKPEQFAFYHKLNREMKQVELYLMNIPDKLASDLVAKFGDGDRPREMSNYEFAELVSQSNDFINKNKLYKRKVDKKQTVIDEKFGTTPRTKLARSMDEEDGLNIDKQTGDLFYDTIDPTMLHTLNGLEVKEEIISNVKKLVSDMQAKGKTLFSYKTNKNLLEASNSEEFISLMKDMFSNVQYLLNTRYNKDIHALSENQYNDLMKRAFNYSINGKSTYGYKYTSDRTASSVLKRFLQKENLAMVNGRLRTPYDVTYLDKDGFMREGELLSLDTMGENTIAKIATKEGEVYFRPSDILPIGTNHDSSKFNRLKNESKISIQVEAIKATKREKLELAIKNDLRSGSEVSFNHGRRLARGEVVSRTEATARIIVKRTGEEVTVGLDDIVSFTNNFPRLMDDVMKQISELDVTISDMKQQPEIVARERVKELQEKITSITNAKTKIDAERKLIDTRIANVQKEIAEHATQAREEFAPILERESVLKEEKLVAKDYELKSTLNDIEQDIVKFDVETQESINVMKNEFLTRIRDVNADLSAKMNVKRGIKYDDMKEIFNQIENYEQEILSLSKNLKDEMRVYDYFISDVTKQIGVNEQTLSKLSLRLERFRADSKKINILLGQTVENLDAQKNLSNKTLYRIDANLRAQDEIKHARAEIVDGIKQSAHRLEKAIADMNSNEKLMHELLLSGDVAKINMLGARMKSLEDVVDNEQALMDYFMSEIGDKQTREILTRMSAESQVKYEFELDGAYSTKVADMAKKLRFALNDMGEKEVHIGKLNRDAFLTMKDSYMPHILTKEGSELFKSMRDDTIDASDKSFITDLFGFGTVFNNFNLSRTVRKVLVNGKMVENPNIHQLNEHFMAEHGIKVYEDDVAEVFLQRALKNNDLLYDDKYAKNLLTFIGQDVVDGKVLKGYKPVANFNDVKNSVTKLASFEVYLDILDDMASIRDKYRTNSKFQTHFNIEDMNKEIREHLDNYDYTGRKKTLMNDFMGETKINGYMSDRRVPFLSFTPDEIKVLNGSIGARMDSFRTRMDKLEATHGNSTKEKLATRFAELREVEFKQIPEAVEHRVNKARKLQIARDSNSFFKMYDKMTHLLKLGMTTISPSFHMRNIQSNMYLTWLSVGRDAFNPELTKDAIQIVRSMGKNNTMKSFVYQDIDGNPMVLQMDELYSLARDYGVVDEGFFAKDIGSLDHTKGMLKFLNPKFDPTDSENFILYREGGRLGNAIENTSRLTHFMGLLRQGFNPEEASERVREFMFDYSDVTMFEQQVMKRLLPFYTWLRKNTALQVDQLIEQPERYQLVAKMFNGIEGMTNEEDELDRRFVSEFARGWIQTPFFNENGEPILWSPNLPINDFDRMFDPTQVINSLKSLFSQSNPLFKIPIEQVLNHNTFFGSDIVDTRYGEPTMGEQVEGRLNHVASQNALYNIFKGIFLKDGSDTALAAVGAATGIKLASYDVENYIKHQLQRDIDDRNKDFGVIEGFRKLGLGLYKTVDTAVQRTAPTPASDYTGALRPISIDVYNSLSSEEKAKYEPPTFAESYVLNKQAKILEEKAYQEAGIIAKATWALFDVKNQPKEFIMGNVVRVADGDTFTISVGGEEQSVRMLLVDTPETVSPNTAEMPIGSIASEYSKSHLLDKDVKIVFDGDRVDRYGRMLGYVVIAETGEDYNKTLIEQGLSPVAYEYGEYSKSREYHNAQRGAKRGGQNIWSMPGYVSEEGDYDFYGYINYLKELRGE